MYIKKIPVNEKRKFHYYYHPHYGSGIADPEDMIVGSVFWCDLTAYVGFKDREDYVEVIWIEQPMDYSSRHVGLCAERSGKLFDIEISKFQRMLLLTHEKALLQALRRAERFLDLAKTESTDKMVERWTFQRDKILLILSPISRVEKRNEEVLSGAI